MNIMEKEKKVKFRMVDDSELPPIVITMNENDDPKVIVNIYHKIWISYNRKVIAGIMEALQGKMDSLLDAYLLEQRSFEREDRAYEAEY